jgi:hypothetical protein
MEHRHSLVPLHRLHEPNSVLRKRTDVPLLVVASRHAVVARLVAVLLEERLAKVAEDLRASTVRVVHAVLDDAAHVVAVVILLLERAFTVVDKAVDELRVAVAEEENADRRLAISTCSTSLL